jgi:arylsulfatase A-like enzyme
MDTVSLLIVVVLAKLTVVSGHAPQWSFWSSIAYVWQDVAVSLLVGSLAFLLRHAGIPNRLTSVIYWALVVYVAVNIPLGRVLTTPLTWPMLRAARGPLADSILRYLTWTHAGLVLLTLVAAAILPPLVRRLPRRVVMGTHAAALLVVMLGPAARARVDTIGLDRNVLVALVSSGFPRVGARPSADDWRISRFDQEAADDPSRFRGAATGRNVVLVSLESTAAQYLSFSGGEDDVTPHLTALTRNALVFENAYAVYPESIKGLFSVLCSIFPAFDSQPEDYEHLPCRSVAAVLADAGYRTGIFHSGRFAYLGMESIVRRRGYDTLEDAGVITGNHQSSFGIDEPATVARILSWIDRGPHGRPFFVTYLPIAGHHPYDTPERGPFPEREEHGRYLNALRYGDESLGALAEGLRVRGLEQKTLWIVLGDHGEAFGQHDGNYGHTFFLYDENVRVPFVIAAPGSTRGHWRGRNVVSLVDTAPTILDLLGIPPPAGYQGRSMLDGAPRMALFFTDYSLSLAGLRDGRWKFVLELDSGRSKMFDLERDPGEAIDVAQQHEARAAWYGRVVSDWSAAQKSYLLEKAVIGALGPGRECFSLTYSVLHSAFFILH